MKDYRLTLYFAIAAMVFMSAAAVVGYRTFGGLAERNLVRIAEENTDRDAQHIQSMMRGSHSM